MPYSLMRVTDQAGDSGPMSEAIHQEYSGEIVIESDSKPQIGKAVRVGSFTARTMKHQDWWMTTPVTEILIDMDDTVEFLTGNSHYIWKRF